MTIHHEAGKGSAPRITADQNKYASNWDMIFGKCSHGIKMSLPCDQCQAEKQASDSVAK